MEALFIIDNVSLNYKWTSIYNTIKRWLVYWLNHNLKDIKTISIAKTYLEPYIIKLEKDKLKLENIINAFESIIIKRAETYDCKNIKYMFDIINNKVKTNEEIQNNKIIIKDNVNYSHIFIFSSIINANLSESNVAYIIDSINNINTKINIFNINSKKMFPIHSKLYEINSKNATNFNAYYELLILFNFVSITNDFNNNVFSLEDIFNKLYEIELEINKRSHWSEEPLSKEKIKIYYDYLDNLFQNKLNLNIETNQICKNYLKHCINYVRMLIFEKVSDIQFNIPIPKYSDEQIGDYAIEIIKFYNFVYPKILAYHYSKQNKKGNFNLNKINQLDISDLKITNFENDDSTNYLYSNITMTNWKQEYENINPFGIFISYTASINAYKGIYEDNFLTNYPNMNISSISNNFISLFDYYQLVYADIDISTKNIFDINNYQFIDNLHGNSNIMLPIYINNEHWKIVKKYWKYHLSFINQAFEFDYNKKMDNIYFLTIIKTLSNITNSKNNQNIIKLLFYILRTCIQVCIDNKYSYNNKADYNKYFSILIESKDGITFNKGFIDYLIRLVQVILTNNIDEIEFIDNQNKLLNVYLIHLIKNDYTEELLEQIKTLNNEKKDIELEIIISKCNLGILCFNELRKDFLFFLRLMKYIFSIKKFNQFIKYLDKYNGCLPIFEDDINCVNIDIFMTDALNKIKTEELLDIKQKVLNTGLFS